MSYHRLALNCSQTGLSLSVGRQLYVYAYYVWVITLNLYATFKADSGIDELNIPYHNYKDKEEEIPHPPAGSELPCMFNSALSTNLYSSLRPVLQDQINSDT